MQASQVMSETSLACIMDNSLELHLIIEYIDEANFMSVLWKNNQLFISGL